MGNAASSDDPRDVQGFLDTLAEPLYGHGNSSSSPRRSSGSSSASYPSTTASRRGSGQPAPIAEQPPATPARRRPTFASVALITRYLLHLGLPADLIPTILDQAEQWPSLLYVATQAGSDDDELECSCADATELNEHEELERRLEVLRFALPRESVRRLTLSVEMRRSQLQGTEAHLFRLRSRYSHAQVGWQPSSSLLFSLSSASSSTPITLPLFTYCAPKPPPQAPAPLFSPFPPFMGPSTAAGGGSPPNEGEWRRFRAVLAFETTASEQEQEFLKSLRLLAAAAREEEDAQKQSGDAVGASQRATEGDGRAEASRPSLAVIARAEGGAVLEVRRLRVRVEVGGFGQ